MYALSDSTKMHEAKTEKLREKQTTVIFRDLNTSFSIIERKTRQKINKLIKT